jgi:hypothetical protein
VVFFFISPVEKILNVFSKIACYFHIVTSFLTGRNFFYPYLWFVISSFKLIKPTTNIYQKYLLSARHFTLFYFMLNLKRKSRKLIYLYFANIFTEIQRGHDFPNIIQLSGQLNDTMKF